MEDVWIKYLVKSMNIWREISWILRNKCKSQVIWSTHELLTAQGPNIEEHETSSQQDKYFYSK